VLMEVEVEHEVVEVVLTDVEVEQVVVEVS